MAWGPSISSPWNLRFVFVVFFIFPSLSSFYVLFYFIFPTIAEHLSFWATVISIGNGFGTSQLLFFFVLFEIRCNIFLCVCYYHYHYYHQIIIFFKFTHLIHAC